MITQFSAISPSTRYLIVFGTLMTILGCGLRIAAARGDLWLDEITSIRLASSIHSIGSIFWGINEDNNHFLNTLYLYLLGSNHESLSFRAMAILQGTLAIPLAGLVAGGARRPAHAGVAMVLFAVSYPMVHFGSEARGYAGLILFSLLSLLLVRRAGTFAGSMYLGIAILLGCLSHFLMGPFAGALAGAEFFAAYHRLRNIGDAVRHTLKVFLMPAIMVGFCALFILSHIPHAAFHIADHETSPWQDMTAGYGIGLEMLVGWYSPYFSQIFIVLGFVLFSVFCGHFDNRMGYLYLLVAFATPLAVFALSPALRSLSNFSNPRYYIPSLTVTLLMLGDCLAIGLATSQQTRRISIAILSCILVGNSFNLMRFYADGRGHYAEAVRDMTAHGPATYGLRVPFGVGTVVDYYARHEGVSLTQIPTEKWCETPPDWWVLGSNPLAPFPRETVRGPPGCLQTFDTPVIYSFWGLSGWEWTVYRRRISHDTQ